MKREDLRILLLQAREDPIIKTQEWQVFADFAQLKNTQIDIHDVFSNDNFSPNIIDDYHALFVGPFLTHLVYKFTSGIFFRFFIVR